MKQITEQIKDLLENESGIAEITQFCRTHKDRMHGDTSIGELFENFLTFRDILLEEIDSGGFDTFSHNRRAAVYTILTSLFQHRHNINHVAGQLDAFQDQMTSSGILINKVGSSEFLNEFKDLTRLKRSVTAFKEKYEDTVKSLEFITDKEIELEELIEKIDHTFEDIHNKSANAASSLQEIEATKTKSKDLSEEIKEINENVEETKLSITTFHNNIEEYKKRITELETKAAEIIAKEKTINNLILQANDALKLGSAHGISAAFAAQYQLANDKKNYTWWIIGALFSLLLAAGFTTWTIGGWGIVNPDSISSIMARVVGVAVTVSAAAFCANQYVKQKNIAEDYAYKAVLSKSIVAFIDELDTSTNGESDEHIKHYLVRVLDEIHKDPLRSRKGIKSNNLSDDAIEKLTKIADIFGKSKG